jgi:death-on-curing protein
MRYLTLPELLVLHDHIITETGGSFGVRDLPALESALAQPRASFDGNELYPDIGSLSCSQPSRDRGRHR